MRIVTQGVGAIPNSIILHPEPMSRKFFGFRMTLCTFSGMMLVGATSRGYNHCDLLVSGQIHSTREFSKIAGPHPFQSFNVRKHNESTIYLQIRRTCCWKILSYLGDGFFGPCPCDVPVLRMTTPNVTVFCLWILS